MKASGSRKGVRARTAKLSPFNKFVIKHQVVKRLLRFNEHAFPHLYVLANILLAIELVTYRGFTFKYLFLDSRLMMTAAVASYSVIFIQQLRRKTQLPPTTQLVLEVNKLVIIPLLLINYLLLSIDLYYYPNYVFSKFHINTPNLQLLLSFNLLLVVLQALQSSRSVANFVWKRLDPKLLINIVFLVSVGAFLLPNLQLVTKWMYSSSITVLRSVGMSWDERFIFLNGGKEMAGWVARYTQFVNHHVADRGVIFIPPQKESWLMEGNPYYIRWFVYPRFTVQSQEIVSPIPPEAEYVLIAQGTWPGMKEYGWPRIFIPADKIEQMVFIDRETLEETVITNQDYNPETMAQKWGVIKLRK